MRKHLEFCDIRAGGKSRQPDGNDEQQQREFSHSRPPSVRMISAAWALR